MQSNSQAGFTPTPERESTPLAFGNNSRLVWGFTLIEVLIYIALFAIIIGGGMVGVYQITQGTDFTNNQTILQEEANFIFRKIDWSLNNPTGITTPATATTTSNLVLTNSGGAGNTIIFETHTNDSICPTSYLCLKRGTSVSVLNTNVFQLNSSSTQISNLQFARTPAAGGKPDAITSTFTLTTAQSGRNVSQDFSMTKYLRK